MRIAVYSLATLWLCADLAGQPQTSLPPSYTKVITLGPGTEWRFQPVVVDLNKDGNVDLVATARLAKNALHIWLGDGKGAFNRIDPTWTDIGYAALTTGDVNRDGSADIVSASHFGGVQTLLNDGKAQFTEKILKGNDGYVAAQLAELNGDGHLDLVLVGYLRAGIEIYFGDGKGDWSLHKSLPEPRPGRTMAGRALAVGDLNRDGHLDLVAAFQHWGVYIYYGDGRGSFTGGAVDFYSATQEFHSIALGDVNKDGHSDVVINGANSGEGHPNGPDVYLGDGRRGWKASSAGLKALSFPASGLAMGDLDRDGNVDLVAGGDYALAYAVGYGLFWFRGDGTGRWQLAYDSGLPDRGLSVPHGIALADLDGDRVPEIISLNGGARGSITVWKQRPATTSSTH